MRKLNCMLLKINKLFIIKHIAKVNFTILLILCFAFSCKEKRSYEKVLKEELKKEMRNDSIIYGVHLGMTYDDFYHYCWARNVDGWFKPNEMGDAVICELSSGFNYPIIFEFFPVDITDNLKPINEFRVLIRYKGFSHYNENMSMENLVKDVISYFEKGYRGNTFFAIPNTDNPMIKNNYVKIDGNRRITLIPSYLGQELFVQFVDLKPLHKNES